MAMLGSLTTSIYQPNALTTASPDSSAVLNQLRTGRPPKDRSISKTDLLIAVGLHQQGQVTDPELVALHLIAGVQAQHGKCWLGGIEPGHRPEQPLAQAMRHWRLRGIKPQATEALARWAEGKICAEVCCGEVTVRELVAAQARGFRYVGIAPEPAFIAHDLCHLFRYYHRDINHVGIDDYHVSQRGFFVLVQHLLPRLQAAGWVSGERYGGQAPLDHVVTDMNGDASFLHQALLSQLTDLMRSSVSADTIDPQVAALSWIWEDFLPPADLAELLRADIYGRSDLILQSLRRLGSIPDAYLKPKAHQDEGLVAVGNCLKDLVVDSGEVRR
jgi:hypothetical protein